MALGQGQSGGLMSLPDVAGIGQATWGDMSGMHPDAAIVGGRGAPTGGVDPDFKYRRVAMSSPAQQPVGQRQHFSEILNFSGSPMPWILLAALAYLGLVHLHVAGKVGPYHASGSVSK